MYKATVNYCFTHKMDLGLQHQPHYCRSH